MRSATDFLPRDISTLMNFATSVFTYFGSGRISRFGISLRRGMDVLEYEVRTRSGGLRLRGFWLFSAVFRPRLLAILDAGGVERAAHHVIANARQVLDAAAADQHDRVLLQIVAFAADVADDFEAVRQANLRHLAERGVR